MQSKQLPPGARALSAKETPDMGTTIVEIGADIRVFRATYRVLRPYSVQVRIRGEWHDVAYSAGRGRHGNTGFPTLDSALTHAGEVRRHVEVGD